MNVQLQTLIADLDRSEPMDAAARVLCERHTAWIESASDKEVAQLLLALLERPPLLTGSPAEAIAGAALSHLVQRQRAARRTSLQSDMGRETLRHIVLLYQHLGSSSKIRFQLLGVLSAALGGAELAAFAELVVADPPRTAVEASLAFAPLFQSKNYNPQSLFPRLLDALEHVSVAAAVLDLANFTTREGLLAQHPATKHTDRIVSLLGNLIGRLGQLEEQPPQAAGKSAQQLSDMVSESVALAVSLCDALALIGDTSAAPVLHQALQLGHRRLHTEAAAALAKLGEESGIQVLASLAAEPVARLRVLAYAEELGVLDQVDDQYKTPAAQAEAELALWLAQPTQMGIAPSYCELIDSRTQYWPGYDDPCDCFLFRYTYVLGASRYSNIGIAGPLTHTFTADLADLSPDDIYAAFAGWQAEHQEIYEIDAGDLTEAQRVEMSRLQRRLRDEGFTAIQPVTLGWFFGERVLVAKATRGQIAGLAVIDASDLYWYSTAKSQRSLGPHDVYCVYKGKKLLRSFNP
jgi:hypothetical protein